MKKTAIRNVFITCAAMFVAAMLAAALLFAQGGVAAYAAEGDTYTQNFASADKVNEDFEAYYQSTMGASSNRTSVGASSSDTTNYYVERGELIRHSVEGDISRDLGTDSFAILTFTKQQYVNFDLTVEYKMGAATYYWPVVAFRQSEAGKYFLETGGGIFAQQEGMVTLWGADVDGIGGPYESTSPGGYDRNAWHKFRIRLDGLDLTVWLDGSGTPALTRKLPYSAFKRGYISLISVNNDSRFRNFSVTELATKALDAEVPQPPKPSADTNDSLDKLAEKVDKIDELGGKTQSSATVPEKPEQPKQVKGCGGAATASATVAALGALAVSALLAIGKKKRDCRARFTCSQ